MRTFIAVMEFEVEAENSDPVGYLEDDLLDAVEVGFLDAYPAAKMTGYRFEER